MDKKLLPCYYIMHHAVTSDVITLDTSRAFYYAYGADYDPAGRRPNPQCRLDRRFPAGSRDVGLLRHQGFRPLFQRGDRL